jgi:hypothetical protein
MEGYAKVAQLMATQEEFAILRRFRVINMQRLLYLQAEISHLEAELYQLAKRDETHAKRQYHAKDWWSLSQGGGEEDLEQWHKFLELSEKLEQYSQFSPEHWLLTLFDKISCRQCCPQASISSQTREAKKIRPRVLKKLVSTTWNGIISPSWIRPRLVGSQK